jgi:thiol-disulfide isomerase/thioredoxin
MPYLVAALVLVAALSLMNALFTFGVIRRLREHERKLADLPQDGRASELMLSEGATVADFAATTVDGEPISAELLAGRSLVGFFSPECEPCQEQLPRFVEYAADIPGGRQQVLAVLTGDEQEVAEMRQQAAEVARVVLEPHGGGPVAQAFAVAGFPAMCMLDGRTALASGHELDQLPTAAKV